MEGESQAAEVARVLGELYASARVPIIVVTREGRFIAANQAALHTYGYTLAELRTMRVHDIIAESRDVDADLGVAIAGASLERRLHRKKDGTLISVLPTAHPMTIGDERLIVSMLQDVTPLAEAEARARAALAEAASLEARTKAMYAELLAADRLASIGRVVAGVAHEINNPAAAVTVNLGVLKDRLARGDSRRDQALTMVDESLEAMSRIRDIVRDLKGFARERASERVDLSALTASVLRMTQHEVCGRVRVDQHLAPGVFANVRSSRVSQVVTNLLVNAAQALPDGAPSDPEGQIVLSTFRDGALACIEVSDTGPGVPAHLVDRIFEPFFTTREDQGGTGLGLWLARGIVEEEGGTIRLTARPGGGAVFRVSLPAAGASSPA